MLASELDAAYTRLCSTMTDVGELKSPLFLARFALLAIEHIGDAAAVDTLIAAAAHELPEP